MSLLRGLESQGFTEVIVFGVGGNFSGALDLLRQHGKEVVACSDNNSDFWGREFSGILCISIHELSKTKIPIFITSMYASQIARQLSGLNTAPIYDLSWCFDHIRWRGHFDPMLIKSEQEKIDRAKLTLGDEQSRKLFESLIEYRKTGDPSGVYKSDFPDYFHPLVHPEKGDVIVDGGAWEGDSARNFIEELGGDCRVISFECDSVNFEKLRKNLKCYGEDVFQAIKKGLWSSHEKLYLVATSDHSMQLQVTKMQTDNSIDVVSLDDFIAGEIDFVKMDIEGSEIEAIKGMRRLIKNQKPKCAICIYHRSNDLWEIPLLLKSLNPSYTFYLGHHSHNLFETTLYAI